MKFWINGILINMLYYWWGVGYPTGQIPVVPSMSPLNPLTISFPEIVTID